MRTIYEQDRTLADGTIVPKLKLKYRTRNFGRFKSKTENKIKKVRSIWWHLMNPKKKSNLAKNT